VNAKTTKSKCWGVFDRREGGDGNWRAQKKNNQRKFSGDRKRRIPERGRPGVEGEDNTTQLRLNLRQ